MAAVPRAELTGEYEPDNGRVRLTVSGDDIKFSSMEVSRDNGENWHTLLFGRRNAEPALLLFLDAGEATDYDYIAPINLPSLYRAVPYSEDKLTGVVSSARTSEVLSVTPTDERWWREVRA